MIAKMDRRELLDIVTSNRDKHRAVFLEALDGYRKAAIAELERALEDAKSGKEIFRTSRLVQPMDQTKDYNRAIRILECTTEAVIELDEGQFANLVLDQWHWGKQFSAANWAYSTSRQSRVYLEDKAGTPDLNS